MQLTRTEKTDRYKALSRMLDLLLAPDCPLSSQDKIMSVLRITCQEKRHTETLRRIGDILEKHHTEEEINEQLELLAKELKTVSDH